MLVFLLSFGWGSVDGHIPISGVYCRLDSKKVEHGDMMDSYGAKMDSYAPFSSSFGFGVGGSSGLLLYYH